MTNTKETTENAIYELKLKSFLHIKKALIEAHQHMDEIIEKSLNDPKSKMFIAEMEVLEKFGNDYYQKVLNTFIELAAEMKKYSPDDIWGEGNEPKIMKF